MKFLKLFLPLYLVSVVSYGQITFGQRRNAPSGGGLAINYSSPREFLIADIEVRGVEFLDNNALISLSGLKVGDKIKIPGDEISNAIKKLWAQGIIGSVSINATKIEGNQIWLAIELSERPRLTRYEFEGISKTQKTELEDKVELVRGKILTDVVMKNAELTVKKYMETKGFLNTKVTVVQRADTVVRNSAILQITIDKGKKVRIHDISFYGNEKFSDTKLRGKMKKTGEIARINVPTELLGNSLRLLNPVNAAHFLTHKDTASLNELIDRLTDNTKINFFKAAKLVNSEYENDKKLLVEFYNSKGYRDAEIMVDTVYATNPRFINIDISVNEGNKYYFRDISWSGNFIHSDEELEQILGIKKGDVYDLELIQKKLHYDPTGVDISSLYMDNGYLFFNIEPVEIGISNDSIDLEMRIREGSQATINAVTISGNEKTSDHVVLRELRTIPGQKFSRAELIRTQRELSQLGYFDPQKVNPVPIPNPIDETVDIKWELEEQPSDQITLSGGWGGVFGFVGTLGVSFNNFSVRKAIGLKTFPPMGDGQRLSLNGQANGRRYQSYSFSFSEPWLGGRKPNSFGVSYTNSIQRQIDYRTNEMYGWMKLSGITLTLGRRVKWPDDFFVVSNSIGYLQYNIYNFPRFAFSKGISNSVTLNTTIARRSSDNPMYPTRGSDVTLSSNLTPPYSLFNSINYETATNEEKYKWIEYHKWNFDAKYYLPLTEKLVLAPRLHFGFIGTYSRRAQAGPFERFILGGSGLTAGQGQNYLLGSDVVGLRGYPDPDPYSSGESSVTPYDDVNKIIGGTMFTKYVLELRYPVSLAPTATIYLLTYVEAGNNVNNFSQYNPYDLKRSAGVGARIFMPAFGLLGLDWGYGFDPVFGGTGPAGTQFHFSIGQQIR